MGAPASRASSPGACAAGGDAAIEASGAPGQATEVAYSAVRAGVSLGELKRRIERECIARALGESDGNITRAAALLGMKRPRLSQLVKQYGLNGSDAGGQGSGEIGSDVGDSGDAPADGDSCGPEDV
jgi:DNA-binding NtrC family response regulator